MLQRRRHGHALPAGIRNIVPPIRPRFRSIRSSSLRQIHRPLSHIWQSDWRDQQPRPKHVLLRRNIRIESRHIRDARIRQAEVHIQRPHDHPASQMKLVEDSLEVVVQLISKVDIRLDDRQILLAICPRFVIAGVSILEVASSSAVVPHEGEEGSPLQPADVEFSVGFFVDVAAPGYGWVALEATNVERPPAPARGCG